MSAFFKPKGTKVSYFSTNNESSTISPSGWAIELKQPTNVTSAKGEPVDSLQIAANQRVVLHLGDIQNPRYHVLIKYNPELYSYGTVQIENMGSLVSRDLYNYISKRTDRWTWRV